MMSAIAFTLGSADSPRRTTEFNAHKKRSVVTTASVALACTEEEIFNNYSDNSSSARLFVYKHISIKIPVQINQFGTTAPQYILYIYHSYLNDIQLYISLNADVVCTMTIQFYTNK